MDRRTELRNHLVNLLEPVINHIIDMMIKQESTGVTVGTGFPPQGISGRILMAPPSNITKSQQYFVTNIRTGRKTKEELQQESAARVANLRPAPEIEPTVEEIFTYSNGNTVYGPVIGQVTSGYAPPKCSYVDTRGIPCDKTAAEANGKYLLTCKPHLKIVSIRNQYTLVNPDRTQQQVIDLSKEQLVHPTGSDMFIKSKLTPSQPIVMPQVSMGIPHVSMRMQQSPMGMTQMPQVPMGMAQVPMGMPQVPMGMPQMKPVPMGIPQMKPVPMGIPQMKPVPMGIPQMKPVPMGMPQMQPVPMGMPQMQPVPMGMSQMQPVQPIPTSNAGTVSRAASKDFVNIFYINYQGNPYKYYGIYSDGNFVIGFKKDQNGNNYEFEQDEINILYADAGCIVNNEIFMKEYKKMKELKQPKLSSPLVQVPSVPQIPLVPQIPSEPQAPIRSRPSSSPRSSPRSSRRSSPKSSAKPIERVSPLILSRTGSPLSSGLSPRSSAKPIERASLPNRPSSPMIQLSPRSSAKPIERASLPNRPISPMISLRTGSPTSLSIPKLPIV